MKKGWTTTKLIAAGSFGALRLVLSLPGVVLAAITGIPFLQGAINFPIIAIMFAITPLVIGEFGAVIVMALVVNILAIPLPLIGPPGFLPKIVVGVAYGIVADIVYALLKRNKKLAAIAVGAVIDGFAPVIDFSMWSLLSVPGAAEAARVFLSPIYIVIGFMFGGVFGYIAWFIYTKLRNTTVIKRIQA